MLVVYVFLLIRTSTPKFSQNQPDTQKPNQFFFPPWTSQRKMQYRLDHVITSVIEFVSFKKMETNLLFWCLIWENLW